jgi:hypothetical protein
MEDYKVLTVVSYIPEDDGKVSSSRITIAPMMVDAIIASEESILVDNREVSVMMTNGNSLGMNISLLDLNTLESTIGAYALAFVD